MFHGVSAATTALVAAYAKRLSDASAARSAVVSRLHI
jgi:hypothetical protein